MRCREGRRPRHSCKWRPRAPGQGSWKLSSSVGVRGPNPRWAGASRWRLRGGEVGGGPGTSEGRRQRRASLGVAITKVLGRHDDTRPRDNSAAFAQRRHVVPEALTSNRTGVSWACRPRSSVDRAPGSYPEVAGSNPAGVAQGQRGGVGWNRLPLSFMLVTGPADTAPVRTQPKVCPLPHRDSNNLVV